MKRTRSFAFLFSLIALSSAVAYGQQSVPPERVVGRDTCAKCHATELKAWEKSKHGDAAWKLLDHPKAEGFAKALGIAASDIKTSVCTECHGTNQKTGGQLVIAHGNSCESCHGGAGGSGGWLETHADYGFGIANKSMSDLLAERTKESASHKAERMAACEKAGMNRSQDAFALASNCLQCHLVPDEKLIDAGHPSSEKFEFVEWAQGEVRHNFLLDQSTNAESPSLWLAANDARNPEGRKKLMYVAGQLADLEISLRERGGVGSVKRGSLGDLLNDRIEDAIDELADLEIDDLAPVLAVVEANGIDKKSLKDVGDADAFKKAADGVREAAIAFLQKHADGDKLPKIKLPKKAKGDVFEG